jgi:hypothetical protein
MSDTLDPKSSLKNILHNWWKIVLIAYLFSLVGLVASYLLPAKYQAEAILSASIDFTEINYDNLVDDEGNPVVFGQYEEDLALAVVERFMVRNLDSAFAYAQTLDSTLTLNEFERDSQIARYHAEWYLRFRHPNAGVAQKIVNHWANLAIVELKAAQDSGEAEDFVIVDLVREAPLPAKPIYQARGTLVLAGIVIGIVVGLLVVDGKFRFGPSNNQED